MQLSHMQNITHLQHIQLQGIVNTETTNSAHKQKKQQRLINDYISSITSSGNKFFTAFKTAKLYVPITRYSIEKKHLTSIWFWTHHHIIRLIHKLYKNSHQWHCEFVCPKEALQFSLNYKEKKIILHTKHQQKSLC